MQHLSRRQWILLVLLTLVWGLNWPVMKFGVTGFQMCIRDRRRRILDLLKSEPGCNVSRVCEHFDGQIGRFSVMKHLAVLEGGRLIVARRVGREKHLWFDPTPIQLIHERWTTEFSAYWAARLTRLRYSAEGAEIHAPVSYTHLAAAPAWA